ncbi:MAG: WbqC family protein [Phycisphaerales bacterium]|nr:WbqC family protein [Phycisphaerales bacterium]
MNSVVCPVLPFPNIYWWSHVLSAEQIILDQWEHFEKMSFRNRYMVAGSGGIITLSIPIAEGRQQRKAMRDIRIDAKTQWQNQHWRTLQSAYNRSPYFEFFESELAKLYQQEFEHLVAFSKASIDVINQLLKQKLNFTESSDFIKLYPEKTVDIRSHFRSNRYLHESKKYTPYTQLFQDRLGFQANLSLLDLLFMEGNFCMDFIGL